VNRFFHHSITPVLQKAVIFARDVKKPPPGANQSQVLWAWILYNIFLRSALTGPEQRVMGLRKEPAKANRC
jgi:hypothetical protein